jgi:hypothetical protein
MKKMMWMMILGALSTTAIAESTGGGNGGDTVICREGGRNVYRFLDSVMAREEQVFTVKSYASAAAALSTIQQKLVLALPEHGGVLQQFIDGFKGRSEALNLFWGTGRLPPVDDERLLIGIPANCGSPRQTVVYSATPVRRYYYDAELVSQLERQGDEISWLVIHEWLRLSIDNSDHIRIVNAYLHSTEFYDADVNTVVRDLGRLNFRDVDRRTNRDIWDEADLPGDVTELRAALARAQRNWTRFSPSQPGPIIVNREFLNSDHRHLRIRLERVERRLRSSPRLVTPELTSLCREARETLARLAERISEYARRDW